jgi:hypothetical protein
MMYERATAERGSSSFNGLIERLLRKIGAGQIACSTCTARATSIRNRRPTCALCARIGRQRKARAHV